MNGPHRAKKHIHSPSEIRLTKTKCIVRRRLFNPKGGPKNDDWQADSTIQVHFHRRAGSLYMDLKNADGKKEETAWVISKIGPDGKELCGKFKCTKTAEDED